MEERNARMEEGNARLEEGNARLEGENARMAQATARARAVRSPFTPSPSQAISKGAQSS